MTASTLAPSDRRVGGFRHDALFYDGSDGFVDSVLPFIRDGVEADEAILVVVDRTKIERLRAGLDGEAESVRFADMANVGRNPALIISAWRAFVADASRGDRALRGVGEPIWPGRSPTELVECHLHESLLNLAFADAPPFWLVCPYDTSALEPDVVETAERTHPSVLEAGRRRFSDRYPGLEALAAALDDPLPPPADPATALSFDIDSLVSARTYLSQRAREAGLAPGRVEEIVLAANEVATNSVRHGGGRGTMRTWVDGDVLICEVQDAGSIADPLVGREAPAPNQRGGRGLWMANQLCDLVQVRSSPDGVVVRLHMHLG